jgi:hypothetical protein
MRIFVLEMAEKAQFPGCLMNVVKMADGRWLIYDEGCFNMIDVHPFTVMRYHPACLGVYLK